MKDKIKKILMNTLDLREVPETISQHSCENWDSMHHLQLIIELETEFDISFEPEDIAEMKSLNEIEKKVSSLLG